MKQTMDITVLVSVLVCMALVPPACEAALNIGTDSPEELVLRLRRSIFVETTYLAEREGQACSSLDGPQCYAALMGEGFSAGDLGSYMKLGVLDAPGVIPERLLHDLGADTAYISFYTPEYNDLENYRQQLEEIEKITNKGVSVSSDALGAHLLDKDRRIDVGHGTLHFADLIPDGPLPLTFSRGLPHDVVATWDGQWLVRDCGPGHSLKLTLPSFEGGLGITESVGMESKSLSSARGGLASTVAALSNSVGYLRFSKPVIVRSLFVRWQSDGSLPPAVVGGRHGLKDVWSAHLDPAQLRESEGWHDISGDSLQSIDEIVFIGTLGIEVGAVDVVSSTENEEQPILLLEPANNISPTLDNENVPQFMLKMVRLTAAATPYVMSLQDIVERNLRLHVLPGTSPISHVASVPGLWTTKSPPLHSVGESAAWSAAVAANEAIFHHQSLVPMLAGQDKQLKKLSKELNKPMKTFGKTLPDDLKRDLKREKKAIVEALRSWSGHSGVQTPAFVSFQQDGNEDDDSLARYTVAKHSQTKLDLLSAAMLHKKKEKPQNRFNIFQSEFTNLQHGQLDMFAVAQALLQQVAQQGIVSGFSEDAADTGKDFSSVEWPQEALLQELLGR